MDFIVTLSILTQSISIECYYECRDAECLIFCSYAEHHFAEYRYAESRYAECRGSFKIAKAVQKAKNPAKLKNEAEYKVKKMILH